MSRSRNLANGSHIADDVVSLAKMASGTDGNVISYDASGNPVAIATGTDGQVLTSTGAGSPPAFEAGSSLVFLEKYTCGTDTSKEFNLSSYTTFPVYKIIINSVRPSADNQDFKGTVGTSSGYQTSYLLASAFAYRSAGGSGHSAAGGNATDCIIKTTSVASDTDRGISGVVYLFQPQSTSFRTYTTVSLTSFDKDDELDAFLQGGIALAAAQADTHLKFIFAGGAQLNGGSIVLYGLKDA